MKGTWIARALIFCLCMSQAWSLKCFTGVCEDSTTDGVCQEQLSQPKDVVAAGGSEVMCAEVKFVCNETIDEVSQLEGMCTGSEKTSGVAKKAYFGFVKEDCDALESASQVTEQTCCSSDICNTPTGNPDADDPTTLYCYIGYCQESTTDQECKDSLQVGLFKAPEEHDIEANPFVCYSFSFVCDARVSRAQSVCTTQEDYNREVKVAYNASYASECENLQDNGQAYVGTRCCYADLCNAPGTSLFSAPASALLPSLLVSFVGAALVFFAARRHGGGA